MDPGVPVLLNAEEVPVIGQAYVTKEVPQPTVKHYLTPNARLAWGEALGQACIVLRCEGGVVEFIVLDKSLGGGTSNEVYGQPVLDFLETWERA